MIESVVAATLGIMESVWSSALSGVLLAQAVPDSGGAPEPSPNPIVPEVGEMFWGAIAFTTLFLLINFVLLPPLQHVMELRKATIQNDLDAADIAKAEAATAKSEVASQLDEAKAEANRIVEAARLEANEERQQIIARSEREAAAIKEASETEIAAEREQALAAIRPQMADLAVGTASRVLDKPINSGQAQAHIDNALNGSH